MKIFNEQHDMKSVGALRAPSDASPRRGLRRQSRRSNVANRLSAAKTSTP